MNLDGHNKAVSVEGGEGDRDGIDGFDGLGGDDVGVAGGVDGLVFEKDEAVGIAKGEVDVVHGDEGGDVLGLGDGFDELEHFELIF